MKSLSLFILLSTAFFSFSQTDNFTGSWFLPDQNSETPLGYEFKDDGTLLMFDVDLDAEQAYNLVEGTYYFEEGSDLLVILTWEESAVITSKFHYSLKNGKLHLTETYPKNLSMVFERDWDIANL